MQEYRFVDVLRCCTCDVEILLPTGREDVLRNNPRLFFYCPNGHEQHFSPAPWRKRLEKEKEARKSAEREAARAKSEARQLRRRIAGECKLCGRVFEGARGLAIHMGRIHPKIRALPEDAGPDAYGSGAY